MVTKMSVFFLSFSEMLFVCCEALSTPLCREEYLSRESLSLVAVKFAISGSSGLPLSAPSFASQKMTASSVLTMDSTYGKTSV